MTKKHIMVDLDELSQLNNLADEITHYAERHGGLQVKIVTPVMLEITDGAVSDLIDVSDLPISAEEYVKVWFDAVEGIN